MRSLSVKAYIASHQCFKKRNQDTFIFIFFHYTAETKILLVLPG